MQVILLWTQQKNGDAMLVSVKGLGVDFKLMYISAVVLFSSRLFVKGAGTAIL